MEWQPNDEVMENINCSDSGEKESSPSFALFHQLRESQEQEKQEEWDQGGTH